MNDSNTKITPEQAQEVLKLKEQQNQTDVELPKIQHPDPSNPQYQSLGRVEYERPKNDTPAHDWKNLPVDYLPSGGKYYVKDARIHIRAATTKDIRHYSTIEPEDLLDVDDKLNFILDNNCKYFRGDDIASFKDLLEIDRFFIILAIRDLTFSSGQNTLRMDLNCHNCGHVDTVEISKEKLNSFKLDERLDKFYDPDQRCFNIKVRGINEPWQIYIPTLGVTTFIKNITRVKAQTGKYIDRFFLKFGPFLFQDWRALTERNFKSTEEDTMGWNKEKISAMDQLVSLLEGSVDTSVVNICSACGTEVKQTLSFRGGFKSLFLYTNILDELE